MSEPRLYHDCCDFEVDSHINFFLDNLPQAVCLDRMLNLTLDDPAQALSVLYEVRAALVRERRKAEALLSLRTLQNSLAENTDKDVPPVGARNTRHTELLS
jgi:hypothetical protein